MTLKSTSLMAALLAASLSSPVLAQEIDADADDQLEIEAEAEASARSAPPSNLRLDEVVVTAQKRAQDVRDVPIAMSVLSGQEMREQGITNFNDAAMLIPNVSINTDAYAMYIRGIGTAEANVLAEQAIGIINDGVYVARLEFMRMGFVDIERVEVLRGPQGTLFGRNSPAGVVNFTTGTPDQNDWGMRAEGTYGQFNEFDGRLMLTGPIWEDRIGFRLNVGWSGNEGHVVNRATSYEPGHKETKFVRGSIGADITDSISMKMTANWWEYDADQAPEQHNTADELQLIFTTQDPNFEDQFDRRSTTSTGVGSWGQGHLGGVELNWDLDSFTLTSVTGFAGYGDTLGGDFDATLYPVIDAFYGQTYEQFTQELRITSGPGTLEYIAGLFYMNSTTEAWVDVILFEGLLVDQLSTGTIGGLLGPAFDNLPLEDILNVLTGTVIEPITGELPLLGGDHLIGDYAIEINSYAFFYQVDWHITEQLKLSLGGRATYEEKEFEAHLHPAAPVSLWAVYLNSDGYDEFLSRSETDFSPKISLTWEPLDEITTYITWAEGFRAGSFNITALRPADLEFETESSITWDAGIKTQFWDGRARANLGLFHTEYDNLQLSTFQTVTFVNSNAKEVRVQGAEFDLTLLPLEGVLFNFAVGYTNGKFITHDTAGCHTRSSLTEGGDFEGPGVTPPNNVCDLSGRQLHRAPRWSGSATIGTGIPLGNLPFVGTFATTVSYKGFEYLDSDLDPLDSQKAYWIVGVHAGLRDLADMWALTVHVKNAADRLYKTFSSDVPITPGAHMAQSSKPRSVSLQLEVSF